MKKNNLSIIVNLLGLLFLFATFFLHFEYLIVTRIVLIVFTILYLMIEIKKEYFLANKMIFIIFSVVSMIALVVSILYDTSVNNLNNKVFLIPVYVYILIVIMYKDLYDKNK